jgi:hypothetical protein
MPSADSANRLISRVAALAQWLAERDVVVASLRCDWASFGSWSLQAQKGRAADAYGDALKAKRCDASGPEVLRASWDGRERLLTIEHASTPPLSSPGPWKRETERKFGDFEAAVCFVEEHIARWVCDEP